MRLAGALLGSQTCGSHKRAHTCVRFWVKVAVVHMSSASGDGIASESSPASSVEGAGAAADVTGSEVMSSVEDERARQDEGIDSAFATAVRATRLSRLRPAAGQLDMRRRIKSGGLRGKRGLIRAENLVTRFGGFSLSDFGH